jgi:electron transport complex protein RnfD
MWWVNGALAPAALWGVFVFGVPALLVMLGAIAGAVLTEWGVGRLMAYREGPLDGSAFCTGLLLAMTLPPRVAPWMAFLGGVFAIGVGKMLFGGLGDNLFNPALLGRAFLMATFRSRSRPADAAPPMDIGLDAVTTRRPGRVS